MTLNLHRYDWIVINSGAGKDSVALIDEIVRLAAMQGVERSRLVVAHDDRAAGPRRSTFSRTRRAELAEIQARYYGLRFQVVSGGRGSTAWRRRAKLITTLVDAVRLNRGNGHPVQVLNCFAFHAGPARAVFTRDERLSNGRRHIDTWLPIYTWTADDVSTRVQKTGVPTLFGGSR